jgi:hypothetical protein
VLGVVAHGGMAVLWSSLSGIVNTAKRTFGVEFPGLVSRLPYAPSVSGALWVGAATGLAGAAVGGAITYLVSIQQIKESRAQRLEAERSDQARRSLERRSAAYADFLTSARRFRNAVRPPHQLGSGLRVPIQEIDTLGRAADAAGSLIFLVSYNARTEAACATAMRIIGQTLGAIHEYEGDPDGVRWDQLNEDMEQAVRDFQGAAKAELRIDSGAPVPATLPIDSWQNDTA